VELSEVRLRGDEFKEMEERLESEVGATPGCSFGVGWAIERKERDERDESEASGWRREIEGGGGSSAAGRG